MPLADQPLQSDAKRRSSASPNGLTSEQRQVPTSQKAKKSWMKDVFGGLPEPVREVMALRNSSLQGAYFIMAARALGLDTGPMSGFNNVGVDADFFPDTTVKSNFIATLGHGDPSTIFGRLPRPDFGRFNTVL